MKIINISPRGYCYGVIDAMVIAKNAALDKNLPRPIYILGQLVHNDHVVQSFESIGIHTLDGENRLEILEQIEHGTVIFTAHGVSPQVFLRAKEKGLTIIDATCPDVLFTHELIEKKITEGFDVLFVGKKNHPETQGALGISAKSVHLVTSTQDIPNLNNKKLFLTNQTTLSQWDLAQIIEAVSKKYPHVQIHQEICQATQQRQEAVAEQAIGCDLVLVVGDTRSNNSNRLAQVAIEQANTLAYRIGDVSQIQPQWLQHVKKIAVTAGASTPTPIVREVLTYLEKFNY
ncbi:MAG: 4-hydroxy-3-methylbut-2-enyl diphosphate reductase, partial [Streptococcaceae bacterium]|nr:4-hydroxy-3-methylbut-2-enyl diphosphate reductase [Streptococcaceae bacterium]